jgi:hypothetical protein
MGLSLSRKDFGLKKRRSPRPGTIYIHNLGYEPFHLTGDEGVLDEIDQIVAEQQTAGSAKTGE